MVEPYDSIQSVCKEQQTYATSKSMILSVKSPKEIQNIFSDPNVLIEIIDNLLSNAVKYSFPETTIIVELSYFEQYCRIAVTDQGQGISEEDQKQLYKKFSKLTARPTGSEHSSGLGLSIVKKKIELLGGSISCSSTVGIGTTFTVQLLITTSEVVIPSPILNA